jgi:integrase/recombinase XerD
MRRETPFLKPLRRRRVRCGHFANVLLYTECRISEALALTAKDIDLSAKVIVFETLKKRKRGLYRRVPVPSELLDSLDMIHGLRQLQRKGRLNDRLWPWCRMTAWRKINEVIKEAGIADGPHSSPKGLRHGFGIAAVSRCSSDAVARAGADRGQPAPDCAQAGAAESGARVER